MSFPTTYTPPHRSPNNFSSFVECTWAGSFFSLSHHYLAFPSDPLQLRQLTRRKREGTIPTPTLAFRVVLLRLRQSLPPRFSSIRDLSHSSPALRASLW